VTFCIQSRKIYYPRNTLSAARKVLENTEHCLLVGKGAQKFIEQQKIPLVKTEELLTERELGNDIQDNQIQRVLS
jgi:isoaspartyl peptidase/L-asparaginase-like protein (Ntn-hydrolase superfamily)